MMARKAKQLEYTLSRRSLLLGGLQVGLTSALVGRLFYLQAIESSRYEDLSKRNRFDYQVVPPSRGRIFDIQGRLLAGNAEAYALNIVPSYTSDLYQSLQALASLIALPHATIVRLMELAENQAAYLPLTIRDDLNQREVARVAVRGPELPGVSFDRVEKRIYPQGLLTGHLTGYVGRVSEEDLASGRALPELAHLYNGKSGVERTFEPDLRGTMGQERVLVNAFGRPMKRTIETAAVAGDDVHLTIDINLQSYAMSILQRGRNKPISMNSAKVKRALARDAELAASIGASGDGLVFEDQAGRVVPPEAGSVIVIDVETGALKALVSAPVFDPNILSGRVRHDDWQNLVNHPRTPLLDRSIKGQYAPGSAFKMMVALAALEAGIIDTDTHFSCPGHRDLGDARFHCWKKHGHGRLNIIGALEQSCDVFFYEVALKTGIERIADMAKRFGIGQITDIMLPDEKPGLMPTKKWKQGTIGEKWTLGETVVASIGQGYVLTTPLQLAVMTARLAKGREITPHLLDDAGAKPMSNLGISNASLAIIRRGMKAVVSGKQGTARQSQLDLAGIDMAGKTGTVQVRRITADERERGIIDNIDRPWKFRDHALFVGYAPVDKPKYAIAVVVEHGGSGSTAAAPIARDVMTYLFEQDI